MKKLLTMLLVFLLCSTAHGAGDIYIATDGTDDAGCGAIGDPCAGIQYSIDNKITDALGGWNLILRQGTYQEQDINIPVTKTGIAGSWNTIRSHPNEWAIVDGQRLNASGNTRGLFENLDGYHHNIEDYNAAGGAAGYWIFERLGLTGGGNTGEVTACAIQWVYTPVIIRYCYIYGNLADIQNGNSAGIRFLGQSQAVVEYNVFRQNGSLDYLGNSNVGITAEGQWEYNSSTFDPLFYNHNNEFKYNFIDCQDDGTGIRTKASSRSTSNRTSIDTDAAQVASDIHHNIITDAKFGGIFYQKDYSFIHNNIITMTTDAQALLDGENWGVSTRRTRTVGVDMQYSSVFNNTIFASAGAAIFHDIDAKQSGTEDWFAMFWVNNIVECTNYVEGSQDWPFTYGHRDTGYTYYNGEVWPDDFDLSGVLLEDNYIYKKTTNVDNAILYGSVVGPGDLFSISDWLSQEGSVNFQQLYDAANLLFKGVSGADQYIPYGEHTVDGSTPLRTAGAGKTHPFRDGVVVPSYLGGVNPDDNDWVLNVLAQSADIFKDLVNGSIPWWIEAAATNPIVICQSADSTANTSYAITATYALEGARTVASCTWSNSLGGSGTLTATGGNITGTITGLSVGVNTITITLTDSEAEAGNCAVPITRTSTPTSYTAQAKKATLKKATLK